MSIETIHQGTLHVALAHASAFRVVVPSHAVPLAALPHADLAVVIPGPMFNESDGHVEYLLKSGGEELVPSRHPDRGFTLGTNAWRTCATWSAGAATTRPTAAQLWPIMVTDGVAHAQSAAGSNGDRVGRCAAGVWHDGRVALAVGDGLALQDFADRLAAAGARDMAYTDGGGSTEVIMPGFTKHADDPAARPLPSFLGFVATDLAPLRVASGAAVLGAAAWVGWRVYRDGLPRTWRKRLGLKKSGRR